MKHSFFTKSISTLALSSVLYFLGQSVMASHQNTDVMPAANHCFPRVFSQIDQFKSSSGGLRNTNANPRTVVCSLMYDSASPTSANAYEAVTVDMETLPGEMDCTAYSRSSKSNGLLLDSVTVTFPAGTTGEGVIGGIDWDVSSHTTTEVYNYIQCKMPGNGRLFSVKAYEVSPFTNP